MTSTARHLSPRAPGAGPVVGRRAADEGAVGQVPVRPGDGRGACGLCVFGGLWPGLAPGAESAWGRGVRLSLHPGKPSVGPRAGPAPCSLPQGARSAWEASSSRLLLPPGAPWRGFHPGGTLTEAPSRPYTLSPRPSFPQTSWPLSVALGSQPHPSFTPRTWWRAPTGFGAFPYLCQWLAGVGRGIAFVSTETGGIPPAPPGPRRILGHGVLGLIGWRLRGEMPLGTPHSSHTVLASRSVPGPDVPPAVGSASPLEGWPRRDSTQGPGCLSKRVEGGRSRGDPAPTSPPPRVRGTGSWGACGHRDR